MRYIYPKKIIACDGEVIGENTLFNEKTLQIGLYEPEYALFKGKSGIILDFGAEISGGVRLLTYRFAGGRKVRLRFGESVGETLAEIGEKNATNDHAVRDFIVPLACLSDATFGQTGFRFLRIDFLDDAETPVKAIVAACDADERESRGSFTCDDELFNLIWQTAAYTVRLCLKNGYIWDGIKRDRLVWIGDIYTEVKTLRCLFGNAPEIKNSLVFCRDQTPDGRWMNDIPAYSGWWLYNLCEYYDMSGDDEFVKENIGFVNRIISDFSACVAEDGTTNLPFNFIDWGSHYVDGDDKDKYYDEIAGTNYLLRTMMKNSIALLDKFGEDSSLAKSVLSRLEKKSYKIRKYKQIAAFACLSGEKNENNIEVIKRGGAKGLTTFLNYFIFKALAENGEYAAAEAAIREYYGKMLFLGATTFWEDFDVDWFENATRIDEIPVKGKLDPHGDCGRFCYKGYRHSLCHGWSSGVAAYMTEYIAGIRPSGENKDEFIFDPHLGTLNFVNAVYPTDKGDIEVTVKRLADGKIEKTLTAPAGIKIIKK